MELKEGMIFRCGARYYALALIQDGEYLMLSEDEGYGWDIKDSSVMYQIYASDTYNGYIPLKPNGNQTKFVTGWWYGKQHLEAQFIYVDDLDEVKHHFIIKDSMLHLYGKTVGAQVKIREAEPEMNLRTAMEYAEAISDKVEEILQILKFLDEKGVTYTFTDDYIEVSVGNRHYTVTFNKE